SGVHQVREDLGGQVLPGRRVAEETRDVDEHCVEQLGELIGMQLQVVDVLVVAVDTNVGHPLGDAALHAGPLIAGEVKPAALADELQQRVQRVLDRRAHQLEPPASTASSASPAAISLTVPAAPSASASPTHAP